MYFILSSLKFSKQRINVKRLSTEEYLILVTNCFCCEASISLGWLLEFNTIGRSKALKVYISCSLMAIKHNYLKNLLRSLSVEGICCSRIITLKIQTGTSVILDILYEAFLNL